MCHTRFLPRRRNAFTLIELLVVIALILVIFSLGIGYVVFGQDNQHSVSAAQAVTGAMLNARQRAHRDGVPTGIRILFGTNGLPPTQANQLQLIQQPEDYNAGLCQGSAMPTNTLTFTGVDFQGGAAYMGEIDEATIQIGDYFTLSGIATPHRINAIAGVVGGPQTITMDSATAQAVAAGAPYAIIRAPRRLPSEDVIQLPPSVVIDDSTTAGGWPLCQNLPQRLLIDSMNPNGVPVAEIVFAPSGAVVGQGTGADKVLLWLRDPTQPAATAGAPLLLSVQIRTGLIGVYPVTPANLAQPIVLGNNDPYALVKDPRASGL